MRTYEEILEEMRERYRLLSGFDADSASDIGIRLKVLAKQVHGALEELGELERQVFPQTSTGKYLEMHAGTRGLARKGAIPAQGVLRFYRREASASDIPIAEGVLCATRPQPQLQFVTTGAAVLPAGELSVEVPARAVDAGEEGNVAPGSVCLMVTPAPGISGVGNPEPFRGGVDAEDDGALRERLLRSFANISNGTNRAFYYDIAMEREEVRSAAVLPQARGRGTVDVVVACRGGADEAEVVRQLQEELAWRKEINVSVQVLAALRDETAISAQVSIADGYDADTVLGDCESKAAAFVGALEVGEALLTAKLTGALLEVDGVRNCRVVAPAADMVVEESHLVQAKAVTVTRMAVG